MCWYNIFPVFIEIKNINQLIKENTHTNKCVRNNPQKFRRQQGIVTNNSQNNLVGYNQWAFVRRKVNFWMTLKRWSKIFKSFSWQQTNISYNN